MNRPTILLVSGFALCVAGGSTVYPKMNRDLNEYMLDYTTPVDLPLQDNLQRVDASIRLKLGMTSDQTAAGVLDLNTLKLAMIRPDNEQYGASVPKIGILLAYFQLHPQAATNLNTQTRHELGLMIKASDNEMAAKFSRELGLQQIQA